MNKASFNPPPSLIENFNHYSWKLWFEAIFNRLSGPLPVQGYKKASLPPPSEWGTTSGETFSSIIFVPDDAGGAVLAFSDGSNWRRVTDRNIIS